MRLYGVLVEMPLEINPEECGDKVFTEQGKKVIYVVLKHALYGGIIISLLFWRYIVSKLRYWGFKPDK